MNDPIQSSASLVAHDETVLLNEATRQAPVNVEALIRSLEIEYFEEPMEQHQSGSIRHTIDRRFIITVNSNEGSQRRRFTAAHELGHYFLHRDLLRPGGTHADRLFNGHQARNDTTPFTVEHERQANQFAAETIMPAALIRQYAEEFGVQNLPRMFGVSSLAMEWRLFNLGISNVRPGR